MGSINLNFRPYWYQQKVFDALEDNQFINNILPRRAGKTTSTPPLLLKKSFENPLFAPRYYYVYPDNERGKKIVLDVIDETMACVPENMRKLLKSQMTLTLYRNPDNKHDCVKISFISGRNELGAKGLYIDGIIFDECDELNRKIWTEGALPATLQRNGWALFTGTPRGKRWLYDNFQKVQAGKDGWWGQILTLDETKHMTERQIAIAREEMSYEEFMQEFYCSFEGMRIGAYYTKQMVKMEEEKRILQLEYDKNYPVSTYWDIGKGVNLVIVFMQFKPSGHVDIIDYCTGEDRDYAELVKYLNALPYNYGSHVMPWDCNRQVENQTYTFKQYFQKQGLKNVRDIPKHNVNLRISQTRLMLNNTRVDEKKCEKVLDAFREYKQEYNDILGTYSEKPAKGWANHYMDAVGLCAMDKQRPNLNTNITTPEMVQLPNGMVIPGSWHEIPDSKRKAWKLKQHQSYGADDGLKEYFGGC